MAVVVEILTVVTQFRLRTVITYDLQCECLPRASHQFQVWET